MLEHRRKEKRSLGEERWLAIGPVRPLNQPICVAISTRRGPDGRLISFRRANRREQRP